MSIRKTYRDIRRTYKMYKFFERARNNGHQPFADITFWELYRAVKTR